MALAKGKTELETALRDGAAAGRSHALVVDEVQEVDYWYADAGIHDAASFSINFTTPHTEMNAHHAEHVRSVAKALAFARETQSPPFPQSLNAALVQQGADLFHGRTPPAESPASRPAKLATVRTRKAAAADQPTRRLGGRLRFFPRAAKRENR